MIKYKLTNQKLQTHGGCQWIVGKWKETDGSGGLCSKGWLHCYDSPLLAVLHNPMHANIEEPLLWEVEVEGNLKDDNGLKCGYTKMRLVKQIPLPEITIEQKVRYAILCTKEVYKNKNWNMWADNWLSEKDRSGGAAHAAYAATYAAAYAVTAAYAAAYTAAYAAAYTAAYAAAHAAVDAAYAAAADADAAAAADADAADAAAHAAYAAKINLIEIANKAVEVTK